MKNQPQMEQKVRGSPGLLVLRAAILLLTAAWAIFGCSTLKTTEQGSLPSKLSSHMTYVVVNTYPHDPEAFTQGLIYHAGHLYESTGLYGESSLRKVDLETGAVLMSIALPPETFGEGLTLWEDRLLQLTWREGRGFIHTLDDFTPAGEFTYPTEGWGLTQDGVHLIMSDGSHRLYFLNPDNFQIVKEVAVFDGGQPVERLNELEYINGEVFANLWLTDEVVRINPVTGAVVGRVDLSGLLPADMLAPTTDVLNGIAYDPDANRLFVTGKNWPALFEIRLVP